MGKVSSFPLLSKVEFDEACEYLCRKFRQDSDLTEWLSVDIMQQNNLKYLKIVKYLSASTSKERNDNVGSDGDDFEDNDEETLTQLPTQQVTVEYDIVLSPSYQVPVLYVNIKDPSYRCPPTMDTLYRHLVPPHFKAQAENVGVIGGITVTDHPVTNSPVFSIHPCQTAAVLEASNSSKDLAPSEYLTLWIGAMGKCVGLNVPVALAQKM